MIKSHLLYRLSYAAIKGAGILGSGAARGKLVPSALRARAPDCVGIVRPQRRIAGDPTVPYFFSGGNVTLAPCSWPSRT